MLIRNVDIGSTDCDVYDRPPVATMTRPSSTPRLLDHRPQADEIEALNGDEGEYIIYDNVAVVKVSHCDSNGTAFFTCPWCWTQYGHDGRPQPTARRAQHWREWTYWPGAHRHEHKCPEVRSFYVCVTPYTPGVVIEDQFYISSFF